MKLRTVIAAVLVLFVEWPVSLVTSYFRRMWRARWAVAFGVFMYLCLLGVLDIALSWRVDKIAYEAYGDPFYAKRRLGPLCIDVVAAHVGMFCVATFAAIIVKSVLPLRFERRHIFVWGQAAGAGLCVLLIFAMRTMNGFIPASTLAAAEAAVGTSATPSAARAAIERMILEISAVWLAISSVTLLLWVPPFARSANRDPKGLHR